MHISDQQKALLLHPQRLVGQKHQGLTVPVEAAGAHASLLPVCKPIMRETNTTTAQLINYFQSYVSQLFLVVLTVIGPPKVVVLPMLRNSSWE